MIQNGLYMWMKPSGVYALSPSHSPASPHMYPHGSEESEPQCSTLVKYRMRGTQEMKMRLKKPMVERKWATSPRLALPRNILNSTWMVRKQRVDTMQSKIKHSSDWNGLMRKPDLIKSWSWGWAHSQCHTHKGITVETVSISHHDNTCDGHYGSHNLHIDT